MGTDMEMGTDSMIVGGPLESAKKGLEATLKPTGRARGSVVPISIGLLSPETVKGMGLATKVQGTG